MMYYKSLLVLFFCFFGNLTTFGKDAAISADELSRLGELFTQTSGNPEEIEETLRLIKKLGSPFYELVTSIEHSKIPIRWGNGFYVSRTNALLLNRTDEYGLEIVVEPGVLSFPSFFIHEMAHAVPVDDPKIARLLDLRIERPKTLDEFKQKLLKVMYYDEIQSMTWQNQFMKRLEQLGLQITPSPFEKSAFAFLDRFKGKDHEAIETFPLTFPQYEENYTKQVERLAEDLYYRRNPSKKIELNEIGISLSQERNDIQVSIDPSKILNFSPNIESKDDLILALKSTIETLSGNSIASKNLTAFEEWIKQQNLALDRDLNFEKEHGFPEKISLPNLAPSSKRFAISIEEEQRLRNIVNIAGRYREFLNFELSKEKSTSLSSDEVNFLVGKQLGETSKKSAEAIIPNLKNHMVKWTQFSLALVEGGYAEQGRSIFDYVVNSSPYATIENLILTIKVLLSSANPEWINYLVPTLIEKMRQINHETFDQYLSNRMESKFSDAAIVKIKEFKKNHRNSYIDLNTSVQFLGDLWDSGEVSTDLDFFTKERFLRPLRDTAGKILKAHAENMIKIVGLSESLKQLETNRTLKNSLNFLVEQAIESFLEFRKYHWYE